MVPRASSYPAQLQVSCTCGKSSLPSLLYTSKGTHPSSISQIRSALPQATSSVQPYTPKCLAPTCSSATIPLDTCGPQSTGSCGQVDTYLWLNGRVSKGRPAGTNHNPAKKSLNTRCSFVKFRLLLIHACSPGNTVITAAMFDIKLDEF